MISSIVDGDTMPKVYCQNLSGDYYIGVGLFSPFQIGYLMFNEQKRLQLALKVVYLQLPIIEYPQIMKGIYLTHDYNRNPIARPDQFIAFHRSNKGIPDGFAVGFDETAFGSLLRCQFPGHTF